MLPLSIGDPELCETALTTVSVPEMFAYWLQGGRISVGFLGGAQIDRFANINSTVIGDYLRPRYGFPGLEARQRSLLPAARSTSSWPEPRSFVTRVDFITSFGHGEGGDHRQRLGLRTAGPTLVVTDLCVMRPDLQTKELTVVSIHEGVTPQQVVEATGWPIQFATEVDTTPTPTDAELEVLRDLQQRTARAHSEGREGQ